MKSAPKRQPSRQIAGQQKEQRAKPITDFADFVQQLVAKHEKAGRTLNVDVGRTFLHAEIKHPNGSLYEMLRVYRYELADPDALFKKYIYDPPSPPIVGPIPGSADWQPPTPEEERNNEIFRAWFRNKDSGDVLILPPDQLGGHSTVFKRLENGSALCFRDSRGQVFGKDTIVYDDESNTVVDLILGTRDADRTMGDAAEPSAAARTLLDKGVKELSNSDLRALLRAAADEIGKRGLQDSATGHPRPVQLDDAAIETTIPEKPRPDETAPAAEPEPPRPVQQRTAQELFGVAASSQSRRYHRSKGAEFSAEELDDPVLLHAADSVVNMRSKRTKNGEALGGEEIEVAQRAARFAKQARRRREKLAFCP